MTLLQTLEYGVGFLHDGLSDKEISYIKQIYKQGLIRVLIVISSYCWKISDLESHLVIILDAETYKGVEHRYIEYSIPDML